MASVTYERSWLDCQADRIERELILAHKPARVHGGEVRERDVRYHLTPLGTTAFADLEGLRESLAGALGAEQVRVAEEPTGLVLDVAARRNQGPDLLSLLDTLEGVAPGEAVVGIDRAGRPISLSLDRGENSPILIWGPQGSGKSELLRTLVIGLALAHRPAELQLLGIDIGGRELAILEAMPQHLIDQASDAGYAQELLDWLGELIDLRLAAGTETPRIVLICDEIQRLEPDAQGSLEAIMSTGPQAGVHVLAAGRQTTDGQTPFRSGKNALELTARGTDRPGRFSVRGSRAADEILAAYVPAADLEAAIQRINWAAAGGREQTHSRGRHR